MKSSLYKGGRQQDAVHARYDMPVLKDDVTIGRSADRIEREAYERGYASGEKAGSEMGEQRAGVLIERLEGLLKELATMRETIVKEMETQAVELAVSIARKIISKELTVKPEEIVKLAKEALLKIERTGQITIKVNPALYDFFTKHKPDLVHIHPDILIDADPSITRYGTVVMGPVEDVVTDIDEQLKNLIKDLVERREDAK